MNYTLFAASLSALGCLATAVRAAAPIPPEIEDEQVLGIHKEPPHATLMPYATEQEALAGRRLASSCCRVLNGPWKFHWVRRPEDRPADFFRADFDDAAWNDIPVPSNWQVLGYGTPYYRNFGYTFQKDWPRVMSEPPKDFTAFDERNPVGSYRRTFDLPADWQGRRVFLTFYGVDAGFFLWINGRQAGYSVNSRNAAEFDVTALVKPGKNLVAVEVYRYCAGSYLEDQDMWRLSGIFRNVALWSAPAVHVRDFFVRPELDRQCRDGIVTVTAKVKNYGDAPAAARTLSYALYAPDGRPVPGTVQSTAVPALGPGQETTVGLKLAVPQPARWTAETPNLYTSVLALREGDGAPEFLSCRSGFRRIEITGRLFTLNGVPIKLKGANRHEHWPDTGHYVSEERMIRDIEVLKQANCNHVRTCHYSDDPRWYELCDEYGLYLVAEANVECHGWMNVLDREPRWEKPIIDRNLANVENFKNHASVIFWSLGNENGGGANFVAALRAVKAVDPTRPVHYEPFGIGEKNPADVDSQMYTAPDKLAAIAADGKLTKPFYLCEYAHAMFNSMGSLGDYNDLIDKHPELMGGAIWEWQDQGLWNRRDPKRPYLAYGGGFGDVPNDHYFIHKGVVFSDRSPKPHYPEAKRAYQWIGIAAADLAQGKVKIRNNYGFIRLDRFKGSWTLSEDGVPLTGGALGPLDLAPGAEREIELQMPQLAAPKPGAERFLRVAFTLADAEPWAPAGHEVAAAQFKLPGQLPPVVADVAKMPPLTLEVKDPLVTISGKGFRLVFDKTS
ncbi:MAG: glycoside hydrolase family 2 TIM barrel-domain containing protein, partial [Tepidisphaeraceae bacterium]